MANRLTPNHPLSKKVERAEKFLKELGIEIVRSYQGLSIRDIETGLEADYLEVEGQETDSFPFFIETKLVTERN